MNRREALKTGIAAVTAAACQSVQPLSREQLVAGKTLKFEAGPIIFDDALITTALLHGELIPSVRIEHLRARGG